MARITTGLRSLWRLIAVGVITATGALTVVNAQQQAPSEEPTLQTVVVTGSIIKRTDFETPSPVQVVSSADLQQSGYSSVSDVLRNLSANGQGTLSQSFGLAFAGGGSGVALRGLTVGGTLTLIDSERMIPYPLSDDGQRNFVDVSSIPFNVIDSIEVLKDGASAEYGSDAVAGVINVKLKKTFTGFTATAEAGETQEHDGFTDHFALLGGIGDLATDGYNAYLAVEVRHQDNILLSNRSGFWTNLNWTAYGGYDNRYGSPNSAAASVAIPAILGGYVLDPATGVFDANTHFINPQGACTNYAAFQAGNCIYNPPFQIQPQTGNINILSRLTKNLSGDWQAIVTGSFFRSLGEQVGSNNDAYPFSVANTTASTTGIAIGPYFNPYFTTFPPVTLPAGAPNNPFGAPAAMEAVFPQLGMVQTQYATNTYRLFGDLKGTAAGWDIDASAGYMYAALTQTQEGQLDTGMLIAAAASGFNFETASTDALRAAAFPNAEVKDTNTMQVVDLHGARDLLQLPGGPLSMALGVGYYHLYKNSLAPTTIQDAEQTGNNAFALGGQSNDNAYLEFVAHPVHALEFDAAVRYDHYPQYGGSTTPKFGVKYSPFSMVTLRGTYGKGFRAPNPAEAGKSGALFSGQQFNDSTLCPNPANPTAAGNFPTQCNLGLVGLQVSSPTLQPEKSTNWTAGLIFQPLDSTSISFDYWDIKVNQDIQSGANVEFLCFSAPQVPLCQNPNLFPIVRGVPISLPYCTANGVCNTTKITPIGPILFQAFPYFNLSQTHVNGLDIDLSTHWDIRGAGRLTGSLNYTHIFHYIFGLAGATIDLAGTHGPQIISGDTGNPQDRAVASLAWDLGPWNVTASVNYTGHYNLTDPSSGLSSCDSAIINGGILGSQDARFAQGANVSSLYGYCEVQHFTDVDLYARYAINKSWSVHGSVLNVFNTPPPVDLQTYGASGNPPYNPAMAQAGAVGRFFMVGATYTW